MLINDLIKMGLHLKLKIICIALNHVPIFHGPEPSQLALSQLPSGSKTALNEEFVLRCFDQVLQIVWIWQSTSHALDALPKQPSLSVTHATHARHGGIQLRIFEKRQRLLQKAILQHLIKAPLDVCMQPSPLSGFKGKHMIGEQV